MAYPHLTFFCELETPSLVALLTPQVVADLQDLRASVSLAILDNSPERAAVVRRLNAAGIPVTAWLLLPREQGYWFNLDNAPLAAQVYPRFKVWSQEEGLVWEKIGLDIEPDIQEMAKLRGRPLELAPNLVRRLFKKRRLYQGQAVYRKLISSIQRDGYSVESYLFPFIADERKAGSDLLRRATGLVDLRVDTEVWMIYNSFIRPYGPAVLASYGPEAQAIALGVTGGGVETLLGDPNPLTWDELERDLRLAYYWCDQLYLFSLEGCVQQNFLPRLKTLAWDQPILLPEVPAEKVSGWRSLVQSILWLGSHFPKLLFGAGVIALLFHQWKHHRS